MSTHKCPAPGCDKDVPSSQYACGRHWYSIPKPLRDELWAGYREEPLGERHLAAMEACGDFLDQGAS